MISDKLIPGLISPRALSALLILAVTLSLHKLHAGTTAPDQARHFSTLHSLKVNNTERSYRLYAPGQKTSGPRPLMLVLHGGMGNAEETEKTTGMNHIARLHDFIVVYPNGIGGRLGFMKNRRTWNAGDCCGRAVKDRVNDVQFLQQLIEKLNRDRLIDSERVYITGISNGAMMAYRFACEAGNHVAAIVPVAGTLAMEHCSSANNVAVMHIHGSQDSNVPLEGGEGKKSIAGVAHRSVLGTIEKLANSRACSDPDVTRKKESIIRHYFCEHGAPLVFRLVEGGEHVWPGGKSKRNLKMQNGSFSASEVIWNFVKQYKLSSVKPGET
jgi:polyhydroxybutyrate depolymerase